MAEKNNNGVWKIVLACIVTCLLSSATTILITYNSGITAVRVAQAQQAEKAANIASALLTHEATQTIERKELMDEIRGLRTDIKDIQKELAGRK